jgi:hypothetical protein
MKYIFVKEINFFFQFNYFVNCLGRRRLVERGGHDRRVQAIVQTGRKHGRSTKERKGNHLSIIIASVKYFLNLI